jgi:stringent starvation protein B
MQPLPPKKEVALALLERSSVHLHLDPRVDGVVVPPQFRRQPQLVLQVGLNMPVPITDLRLDEDGMSCTLSFSRSPFFCVLPWRSVFAIVGDDGRGMVWPDDVPPEVAQQSARTPAAARAESAAAPTAVPPASKRGGAEAASEATPSSKGRRPRKKPQLAPAPEPAPSEPSAPPPRLAPAPADGQQRASARGPSPLRQPQPAQAKKPKRELPPYLRVVK